MPFIKMPETIENSRVILKSYNDAKDINSVVYHTIQGENIVWTWFANLDSSRTYNLIVRSNSNSMWGFLASERDPKKAARKLYDISWLESCLLADQKKLSFNDSTSYPKKNTMSLHDAKQSLQRGLYFSSFMLAPRPWHISADDPRHDLIYMKFHKE